MRATSYVEHVLEPELAPFFQEQQDNCGDPICVIEDGAAPHRAKLTQEAREHLGIRSLDRPASSPDLNPIEGLWQQLKQNICRLALEERPTTIERNAA